VPSVQCKGKKGTALAFSSSTRPLPCWHPLLALKRSGRGGGPCLVCGRSLPGVRLVLVGCAAGLLRWLTPPSLLRLQADVRLIFSKVISVVDNSGTEAALRELATEKAERQRAQSAEARVRIDLELARAECKRLHRQMALLQGSGSGSGGGGSGMGGGFHSSTASSNSNGGGYRDLAPAGLAPLPTGDDGEAGGAGVAADVPLRCQLSKAVAIREGAARVLEYDPVQQCTVLFPSLSANPP
jgi:hypothetical protein